MISSPGTKGYEEAGNVHVRVDEELRPHEFHRVVARLAVKYSQGGDLLDVGCGMGNIPFLVHGQNPDIPISIADSYQVCIDATTRKLDGKVNKSFILDEATFDVDNIDGQFDVITLSHVLEHLMDPVGGLKKLYDRVAPGGHLIVAVPNPSRPMVVITNIWQRHYVNRGHVAAWDPSHFRNLMERIMGYEVAEYATDSVRPLPGVLGTGLAKVLPWWGFSNIAVIRKPA